MAHDPSLSCGRIFLTVMRRMTYLKQQRCQPSQLISQGSHNSCGSGLASR
ncbi:hypothetical protein PRJ_1555 [Pseudomonas sp. XWY-1]|uniref:Uncharacterized protein n=1 Tax=Pseudomonas putida ND6 TaxID=231023 RepID=I3V070_PSEPU|nr:hypothetical protein YSA_08087 [Pseudomonas putida ND6]AUZ58162.1 hypothetical protein PRJ_1555 [Pseudomonas sp. XWY-1]